MEKQAAGAGPAHRAEPSPSSRPGAFSVNYAILTTLLGEKGAVHRISASTASSVMEQAEERRLVSSAADPL